MNEVFINQTYLEIVLTAGVNIYGAKTTEIRYRKPSGITGSLTAEVTDATSGILTYVVPADSTLINEKGEWRFWTYVKFLDDRVARGASYVVTFGNDEQ
jgi:hypothetical protein